MIQELQLGPAKPPSSHALGKAAYQRLSSARAFIASLLKVKPVRQFFYIRGNRRSKDDFARSF